MTRGEKVCAFIEAYCNNNWQGAENAPRHRCRRIDSCACELAQVAINAWLRQYNQIRPHHALGMRPPVPETLLEKTKISGTEKWG